MGVVSSRIRRRGPIEPVEPHAAWFAGVGEALGAGGDGTVACAVVGRRAARAGVDLGEALDGLRAVTAHVAGREPSYAAVRALGEAWADETLALVHRVTCEDPLTGLGTRAHLQARLREVYRATEAGHPCAVALVVVEVATSRPTDPISRAWWEAQVVERIRLALPAAAVVRRATPERYVVLVRRDADLGRDVAELRALVDALRGSSGGDQQARPDTGTATRAWIEGLPTTWEGAVRLVSELHRH